MIKFLGFPKFQAFKDDGTPLEGGKLYTYEPGTVTAKATYPSIADAIAETNALANPIILDSRGEATVVLKGAYKLLLNDAAGNNRWVKDNFSSDHVLVGQGGEVRLYEDIANGSSYVGIKAPASISTSATFTLPGSDGTSGQVIQTDGSGAWSWVTPFSDLVEDTTPQLGGNLDTNSYNILFNSGDGILDSSSNEQILFTANSSAVNYLNVTNAATGTGPILAAAGDDTNVDLNIDSKGTGNVSISANSLQVDNGATGPGEIRLLEDSDNGSNYMGFKAPSDVTTSTTMILPDGPGTSGQFLKTDGVNTLSWGDPADLWTYVSLASDFTTTSGSPVDVTNLYFTPSANTDYEIEIFLLIQCSSTSAAAEPSIVWPTGYDDGAGWLSVTTSTSGDVEAYNKAGTAVKGTVSATPTADESYPATGGALLLMGASPSGTFKIQVESSNGSATARVMTGSFIKYREL